MTASDGTRAGEAVTRAGGDVLAQLSVVHGVDARLDASALRALVADPGLSVVPDVSVHVVGQSSGGQNLAPQLARMDVGSLWSGQAGAGVGVALIDTGVADTPGIDPSHLVRSPSFAGGGKTYDGYGHGTFMAGLIAGDGAGGQGAVPGVAPGATLVDVKVAGDDGSTTLARVIKGIGWAIDNQAKYHIRVMSLSFGATFSVPPAANPLDMAVEAAWACGITVVAAAGNGGAGQVSSPGDDPAVITVGAETTTGSMQSPSWSGYSDTKPDVVAPGVSVVSLRDPGSVVDVQNPGARVGNAYFLGSGTSMSTALAAGAAAVLLADHPGADPDQVKAALVSTSGPDLSGPAGAIDAAAADAAGAWNGPVVPQPLPALAYFTSLAPGGSASPTSMRWDSMRWDSMRWDSMRWDSMRWDSMRWDSMRWDASAWTDQAWGQ